jgi:multidrug efflux pump subunit AcrA (membrane-fusion protein)
MVIAEGFRPALVSVFSVLLAAATAAAHEGHDHGEELQQQTAQSGPVSLTPEAKKNLEIRTAEAAIQPIEKTIKATGVVQPIPGTRETVSSRIAGRVAELRASLGQARKKGEVLLVLEARQIAETPIRVPVTAPRSGKVARLNVIEGDAVEPGTAMVEIADYREVFAVAKVYESQIGRISVGMPARVRTPVLRNVELESRVASIGSEVDPASRTVDVWVRVKNPEERLKINMNVNVHLLAEVAEETITVPRSAVLGQAGEKFVFVEEGNDYLRTPVVTGIENDKWIEVVEGLAPGDVVVTQGNYQLQFAAPKPVEKAGKPKKAEK